MTILFIGAVYWVWTQIQYVQRKVNALENIVYELKQVCQQPLSPPSPPLSHSPSLPAAPPVVSYPPAVIEEDEDILHETLRAEINNALVEATSEKEIRTVMFEPEKGEFVLGGVVDDGGVDGAVDGAIVDGLDSALDGAVRNDDLQPGGVGSGDVQHTFAFESMTTKELRRLGNQRGISGVNDMKKKEIIAAIRALPSPNIFGAVGDE